MPRNARQAPGGWVFHVLNRAVARLPLFPRKSDYSDFEQVMLDTYDRHPTRILAWCLLKTHWHLILWPRSDSELSDFMRRLTQSHTVRHHVAHGTVGQGPLYQGRYKSLPVQRDQHLLNLGRYVEGNALLSGEVDRAEDWRWSSLWARRHDDAPLHPLLSDWPVELPRNWLTLVNRPLPAKEQERIRTCIARNRPYGNETWQKQTATRLGLMASIRPVGRPPKKKT